MNGKPWSPAELQRLAELYPNRRTSEIAKLLGHPLTSVYGAAHKLGLKKSLEFIKSPESGARLQKGCQLGKATQFRKGDEPANKGLRRPGYNRGRMGETQFKKGERTGKAAENWKPIGTILTDSEGYLRIKIREAVHGKEPTGFGNSRVWPMYNRYVWEKHKGPIPPKHLVVFIDRDRSNCAIENLELISMAENARRNRMWGNMPRELAEAIQLSGVLKRKLRSIYAKEQDQRPAGSPV